MTRLVVDSWAWMEYFRASERGSLVRELVENDKNDIYSSAVSIAEIVSKFEREGKDGKIVLQALSQLSRVYIIDDKLAFDAGEIHARMRKKISDFGLADAFVIATALNLRAKIVSGDPHFKNVSEVIFV